MGIRRVFLNWEQPALGAAADYLIERYARRQECDLSRAVVVVPGGRAGRRLLELLVLRSEERKLLFTPPEIVTEGRLPELLYESKRPLAPVLVQQLTWLKALTQMPPAKLRPLVPHPPAKDDVIRWLELAEMFRKQHAEFAADGLDFNIVLEKSAAWEDFGETDRWIALRDLQATYLAELDQLDLWDAQTARLVAIKYKEPKTDRDLVLLGMADMNRTLRQMLDLVVARVTALIVAPESWAAKFDGHGCLFPEAWQQLPLPLQETQLQRVEGPADQAAAVADWIRDLKGAYAADEVAIGVADEALVPQLQRELAQQGLNARWVEGKMVAESAPYRLLQIATRYAERRRFADLAALVRHPDISGWLNSTLRGKQRVRDPLTTLDRHYANRLSAWLDADDLAAAEEAEAETEAEAKESTAQALRRIVQQLETLFAGWPDGRQLTGLWMERCQKLLETVYGSRVVDKFEPSGRYLLECLQQVQDSLQALRDLPGELQPRLKLTDAVALALQPLAPAAIAPPLDPTAVEILGWLELPLDDAPALVVTTVNEGFVPKSPRVDAFLPDILRRELGLLHDDRRCARDAYALQLLAHSRRDLRLISARFDTNRDPLAPSRLLFTGEPEVVAQRARRWFSPAEPAPPRPSFLVAGNEIPARSLLEIPQPEVEAWCKAFCEVSVTQFRSYLACPYRFYLSHVLRLRAESDAAAELDAPAFGNLLHDVLQDFGREPKLNRSTDPQRLRHYFDDRLDTVAAARCRPRHARAAVRVQIEQARLRLRAFATWQAARNEAGWRIVFSETTDEKWRLTWDVDGKSVDLTGRIDRIDYHPKERTLCILDYKTGDTARPPDQVHRLRGAWVDLQLPLYRHLYQKIPLDIGDVRTDGVQLGYIHLPKDTASVGERIAGWTEVELQEADEQARDVIRSLRVGKFWPPNASPPSFTDEFSAICQDAALDRNFSCGEETA
jgi:ATP-dependent helicase/nuclease subunit B